MTQRGVAALAARMAGWGGGPRLLDHAAETPRLDLRNHLTGPLTASGVFFDRSGRADPRFVADMTCAWDGDTGVLTEDFRYGDGRVDHRVWTIRFRDAERFTVTADDLEGEGVGAQCGGAAVMRYRLRIARNGSPIVVSMEDWLYLQPDGALLNRARMRKFGFTVGEILAVFRKSAP